MLRSLPANRWNFTTAAHLLNRAGFGGPPAEIERLAGLNPEEAVSWLVDYERIPDSTPAPAWARPDPDRREKLMKLRRASQQERRQIRREEQKLERQRMVELRGWWLERMVRGPRPFQEKMTLFWHGHFATSVVKVRKAYYMWRQNELFRRLATANWLELLLETAKDPAMLIWLDQAQNRKPHANENFAREVMELFTLGEGHYTEKDVTEGARALTGWSLDRIHERFVIRPRWHDEGIKTFLGRTGNLDGEAVLEQIVAQPQAAIFITEKLWNYFAGQPPAPALNAALADVFRRSGNNFKPLVRAMFSSEEFYSPGIIRNQVKSPVQWLVGSIRLLETELPPPLVSINLLRSLGQELFAPPNVKGWDGGLAWITTNTLLNRYNESLPLIEGHLGEVADHLANARHPKHLRAIQQRLKRMRIGGVDVDRILTEAERTDQELLIASLQTRLLQSRMKRSRQKALVDYLDSKPRLDPQDIKGVVRLVMSTPEYQLA